MNKINAKNRNTLNGIVKELETMREKINDRIHQVNNYINESIDSINDLVEQFNHKISEADTVRYDIYTKIEDYLETRSEKWKESDRGNSFENWAHEWSWNFKPASSIFHEPLEEVDIEHIQAIIDLSNSPE